MAGKITHLEVLAQVAKHLGHGNPEQRKIASLLTSKETKNYANVGAIAPDIFYFYHILSPIRSSRAQVWGDLHHHKRVAELILNFLDNINEEEEELFKERARAFTFGYICHCVVDIVTHPYIFYISGDYYNKDPKVASTAQYHHLRVEFALDSFLLNHRWGMSPEAYDFNQYVNITRSNGVAGSKLDPVIWAFWQKALKETFPDEFQKYYTGSEKKIIPGDVINDSYIGFVEFNQFLDSRNPIVRGVLKFIDIVTFNKIKSSVLMLPTLETVDRRIMNEEKRPWYYPAEPTTVKNDSFIELVNRAANASITAITTANEYLNQGVKRDTILKEYKGYNLDTGIRNEDISSMKEFAPLI
ncbi:MAG: zinc dependent phospholipase C family protein [Leptospiraceae bacterium]|nr:zinc dependent phospholipase C family protein [Leptospiraceae bacterium]